MKVSRLRLEGFSCYRRPVDIDFSDLELFAISGPTGSGKSSLVDAIIFALYGKIPRLNADVSGSVSQGMKKASVLLEFRVGEKKYQLGRSFQVNKGSQCILDEMENGSWKGVCSGVRQVNQKIVEIMGLDYDAFTRCIVLPQGAFQEFLQDSKGRQDILTRLLGIEVLGEMQREASKIYELGREKVRQIQLRLADDFGGLSGEHLERMKGRHQALEKEIENCRRDMEGENAVLQEKKQVWEWIETLRRYEKKYGAMLSQKNALAEKERQLTLARKIFPVAPQIERYESTRNKRNQLAQKQQASQSKRHQALAYQEKMEIERTQAEQEYGRLPELDREYEKLQGIKQLGIKLKEQEKRYLEQEREFKKERKRLDDSQKQLEKTREEYGVLRKEAEKAEQTVRELEIKKEVLRKFHEATSLSIELKEAREEYERKKQGQEYAGLLEETKEREYRQRAESFRQNESKLKKMRDKLKKEGNKSELERNLRELEEAYHLKERLRERMAEMAEIEKRMEGERKEQQEISQKTAIQKQGLEALLVKMEELTGELQKKKSLHRQVLSLLDPYFHKMEKYEEVGKRMESLKEKEKKVKHSIGEFERARKRIDESLSRERQEWTQARERWGIVHTDDLAFSIRKNLKPGHTCPVCRQTIKKLPPEEAQDGSLLKELEKTMERSQELIDGLEKEMAECNARLSSSKEAMAELQFSLEREMEQERELTLSLKEMESSLGEWLGGPPYEQGAKKISEQIDKMSREKDCLVSVIHEKQHFIAQQEATLESLQQRLKERREKRIEQEKESLRLKEKIESIGKTGETEKERDDILQKIDRIEALSEKLAEAEKTFTEIKLNKEVAHRQYLDAQKTRGQLEQEFKEKEATWVQKREMARGHLGLEVEHIEQALEEGIEQYREVSALLEASSREKVSSREKLGKSEITLARLDSTVDEIGKSVKDKERSLLEQKTENERWKGQIFEATRGKEVETVLQTLKSRKTEIESRYRKAREEGLLIAQEIKNLEKEAESIREELFEASREVDRLETELRRTMEELGLQEVEQLLNQKVSSATIRQLEQEVLQGRLEIKETENNIQRCHDSLAGRSTNLQEIRALEEQIARREKEVAEKLEERGKISQEIKQLEARLGQLQELEAELKKFHQEESVHKQLSYDLRADRFQGYVIEEALRTLAEDGSVQLDILSSGRYAFIVENRDIDIIDRWNADEVRSSKTLSGGETFLASLALALALSERIYQLGKRSGGSSALESLFLDEGFGSLDDEHLDIVVKSLNNLQGTGRTIGIISHLPVLNNYLPARLVVSKDREGSRVHKEGQ